MPVGTENAEFDNFSGYEKVVKKFHSSLRNFKESENPFFDSIIYGLIYNYIKNTLEKDKAGIDKSLEISAILYRVLIEKKIEKEKAKKVLGENLYKNMLEINDEIQLDKTLFGFFD